MKKVTTYQKWLKEYEHERLVWARKQVNAWIREFNGLENFENKLKILIQAEYWVHEYIRLKDKEKKK